MKLPLPQKGQPFDLAFVYKIVEEINNLWNAVGLRVSSYSSIQTSKGNISSVRSSDVRTVAGFVEVISGAKVAADEEKTFSYPFDRPFKYAPIVTVSIETVGDNKADSARRASAVLTQVRQDGISGVVKFEVPGTASIRVNIIAVGIPA